MANNPARKNPAMCIKMDGSCRSQKGSRCVSDKKMRSKTAALGVNSLLKE